MSSMAWRCLNRLEIYHVLPTAGSLDHLVHHLPCWNCPFHFQTPKYQILEEIPFNPSISTYIQTYYYYVYYYYCYYYTYLIYIYNYIYYISYIILYILFNIYIINSQLLARSPLICWLKPELNLYCYMLLCWYIYNRSFNKPQKRIFLSNMWIKPADDGHVGNYKTIILSTLDQETTGWFWNCGYFLNWSYYQYKILGTPLVHYPVVKFTNVVTQWSIIPKMGLLWCISPFGIVCQNPKWWVTGLLIGLVIGSRV